MHEVLADASSVFDGDRNLSTTGTRWFSTLQPCTRGRAVGVCSCWRRVGTALYEQRTRAPCYWCAASVAVGLCCAVGASAMLSCLCGDVQFEITDALRCFTFQDLTVHDNRYVCSD
jgi:hypothetical protein